MFGNRNSNRNGSQFGGGRNVCKFYLEGRCKFGDGCKNEHPSGQNGAQNQNRFGALGNQQRSASGANNQDSQENMSYGITVESIKAELTEERPTWPLSSYGPGRNAPRALLEAEFEQSPEEMRALHYLAIVNGNSQETAQREASTTQAVDQAIQKILADINGAVKYVVDGKDQHPNRIDLTKVPFGSQDATSGGSFGQPPSSQQNPAFGQPSAPAQGAFGQQSSFGQPSSLTQSSAFGQPSTLGQPSSFGQPSSLGQATSFGQPSSLGSAFGKPSALGAGSTIGKPAFGQASQSSGFAQATQTPAFGQTGFGKPSPFGASTTQQQSTFGQPSAFGSAAKQSSPFAAAGTGSQPPQQPTGAFGQPSAFGAAANKPSPFAAASNNTMQAQTTGTFGQPSVSGGNAGKPSPFAAAGQQAQSQPAFGAASPFGAAAGSAASPFGAAAGSAASPFGAAAGSAVSPFGKVEQSPSPFGAPKPNQNQTASPFAQNNVQSNPFTQPAPQPQPAQESPFAAANTQNNTPGTGAHLSKDASGKLTSYKGRQVSYDSTKKTYSARNPSSGKQERIWFPDGPTAQGSDAQAAPELYQGELGQALEKMYLYAREHGVFENGVMPEIPPKPEWVAFDI